MKPVDLTSGEPAFVLDFVLDVDPRDLQEPYLKARWKGEYEITLNGVKVKDIKYSLDSPGGLHINDEARGTLKRGKNLVTIKPVNTDDDSFLELGLIDWVSPNN